MPVLFPPRRYEFNEQFPPRHHPPRFNVDSFYPRIERAHDVILHLHGFQDAKWFVFPNTLTRSHEDLLDHSWPNAAYGIWVRGNIRLTVLKLLRELCLVHGLRYAELLEFRFLVHGCSKWWDSVFPGWPAFGFAP